MLADNNPQIKSYTCYQLRELYGVSFKTFKAWLKPFASEIGEIKGRCYTPKQVEIIFSKIGTP